MEGGREGVDPFMAQSHCIEQSPVLVILWYILLLLPLLRQKSHLQIHSNNTRSSSAITHWLAFSSPWTVRFQGKFQLPVCPSPVPLLCRQYCAYPSGKPMILWLDGLWNIGSSFNSFDVKCLTFFIYVKEPKKASFYFCLFSNIAFRVSAVSLFFLFSSLLFTGGP